MLRLSCYLLGVFFLTAFQAQKNPPNILIILADDAGYEDFGFMGSPDILTPNIDKIAKQGVVFSDAHVTASVCAPSRAGLITGRYQQRFGFEQNTIPAHLGLDASQKSFASIFQENGYATAAFGKWHLGTGHTYHPNQRGFDEFYGFLGGHRSYFPNPKYDVPGTNKAIQRNGEFQNFNGYLTDILGDKTCKFIDKNSSRPFCIYLAFNAVHTPMEAKAEDLKRFEGHPRATLAAMSWAMDRAIGKVIDKLEEKELLDNTLIIFLSDNGGPESNTSRNGPLKSQKGYEFEGGHRVPMLMQWRGEIKGGSRFEGLCSSLDVYPSIIEASGLSSKSPKNLDGTSLLPYLRGEKTGNPHHSLFWRISPWKAARVGTYKLIDADTAGQALYHLGNDLGENTNLKDLKPEQFELLKDSLESWEQKTIPSILPDSPHWIKRKYKVYKELIENP